MTQFPRTSLHSPGSQARGFFRRRGRFATLQALLLLAPGFHSLQAQVTTDLNAEKIPITGPIHMQARNISIQVTDDVQIKADSIDGLLLPARPGHLISLDDPTSMKIQIQNAKTSISAEALTRLLNEYVLPQAKTSVRDLIVSFDDGRVHVGGKLHKMLLEVPFSAEGSISVTANGSLRVHFEKVTAAGFVHKKMLDFLGLNVSSVAGAGKRQSFQVVDDDVIFPMHVLFPPPHFTGHLQSVSIEGDELVQIIGKPAKFAPAPVPAERYIYFRGGVMQFSRLTMRGVDLELLNKDEGQVLNFSIAHIFAQTLPGYSKNLPTRGMVAYIASYVPGGVGEKQ